MVDISVVLASHDRPELLRVAVQCFERQEGVDAELIIVDDSVATPSEALLAGHRTLVVDRGMPLGDKLNLGCERANGDRVAKWDDDDYYGPRFLADSLAYLDRTGVSVTFAQPFLLFDAVQWQLRLSDERRCSGATLVFRRSLWRRHPFPPVPEAVDAEFLMDIVKALGAGACRGRFQGPQFIQLRHHSHMWTRMPDGRSVDEYLMGCDQVPGVIDEMVPIEVAQAWRRAAALQ